MNLMVLGAGVMQIPAIKEAKKMGHFVLCCDGNANALGKEECDLFYPVDLKDKNGLLEVATKFNDKHGLNGVFTVGTDFSASVAYITEKLSLPGISYQTALNATDKYRMRSRFKEEGVPSPNFAEFTEDMNLPDVVSGLDFPLVVKPVDNMGARGVVKVENLKQLEEAVQSSLKYSRTSRVIIEEYMDGPEFSIDSLVYNGEVYIHGFADRDIAFPPYFVELGHNMPSSLEEDKIQEVVEVFKKGVKALGIDYGAAKGDMKLTSKGPMIGEIAARLSGGYMSGWTYPYSSEINLIKGGIELALGLDLTISTENKGLYSSERGLISIPGKVKEVIKPKKNHKEVKELFCNKVEGDEVVFPSNNVEKCGNIIVLSDTYDKSVKRAIKSASEVVIRLEPENINTEEFLFNTEPEMKAFDLDFDLLEGLEDGVDYEKGVFYLKPVDKVLKSRKKDWYDRTIKNVLKQLSEYHKVEFDPDSSCGLDFYQALINGSLQGVLYYLDSMEV